MKEKLQRFLALTLCLLLLCGIVPVTAAAAETDREETQAADGRLPDPAAHDPEPVPKQPAEDSDAQLQGTGGYEIILGMDRSDGVTLWSDTPKKGRGYEYAPYTDTKGNFVPYLCLTDEYNAGAIYSGGDLVLELRGSVTIQAADSSNSYGKSAVDVNGNLDLSVSGGTSRVLGGDNTAADYNGGYGIYALTGLQISVYNGGLTVKGGDATGRNGWGGTAIRCANGHGETDAGYISIYMSPNYWYNSKLEVVGGNSRYGVGGAGISSYRGTYFNTSTPDFRDHRDREYFNGQWFELAQFKIRGGSGKTQGGHGIAATNLLINGNGTVRGGAASQGQAGSAAAAFYAEFGRRYTENPEKELAVSLRMEAGSAAVPAVQTLDDPDGGTPLEDYQIGAQTVLQTQTGSVMELAPETYTIRTYGNGGTLEHSSDCTVTYGQPVYLNDQGTRQGHVYYGLLDRQADTLYVPYEEIWPHADLDLYAQWAPHDPNKALFLAPNSMAGNYTELPAGAGKAPVTSGGDLWGWCSSDGSGMLEQDPSTKQIYGSEIWYAPGDDTLLKPGVYYALEAPQQFANLRLHGNGGTLRNGSNLVVKSTLCVGDEPAIPVGGNPGFARSGYRFDGWQRESGDPINSNMDIHNNVQMDLYAIWTPIVDTTKVHFRDDEGRKHWSFDLNSPFTTPNPATDQYCFWGWANGDPARVGFNEQTLVIGPELFWADAGTTLTRQDSETFYAWYGPKHFTTVRYHGNGGTRGANGDLMVRCAMVIDTGLEVGGDWGFTRPGYQFSGWVDDQGRSYSPRQSIGSGVVDLTAQWSKPVDFGIALNPKTSKIFVVLYSGDRLLTVLENGWNTQMYLPEDLYAQADRAVLFQMDGSSRPTAAAAELTFPLSK